MMAGAIARSSVAGAPSGRSDRVATAHPAGPSTAADSRAASSGGGSRGGFGRPAGPRPPFRGVPSDGPSGFRDDRGDRRPDGPRDRPWDRPATPRSDDQGGGDRSRSGGPRGGDRPRGAGGFAPRRPDERSGRPDVDRPWRDDDRAGRPEEGRRDEREFGDRGGDRPPFRSGGGRPAPDRRDRGFGPSSGPRRDHAGPRPGGDRPWRDAPGRPTDAYRPGVAPSDLLAEDEELVAGRRPVEEAFVARRPARRLLVVPQRRQALERLVLHATSLRIPVVEVEGGTLTAVAGFDGHQGIALVVEPRTYAGLDDVLARALERGEPPFVLVLDSLEDPQNVGTLLRSAEAAGVHGVLFPTHRQAPLTPAAIKASAGAVEHLLLCPVDDLPAALSDLRIRGLRVAAAESDAPLTAAQADLRGPLAIIVGSEGQGLSPVVRRRADVAVRIPMRGAIGSLNAAVAGSILLFAAVAQRDPGGEGSTDRPRPATFDEIADATSAAAAYEASTATSTDRGRGDDSGGRGRDARGEEARPSAGPDDGCPEAVPGGEGRDATDRTEPRPAPPRPNRSSRRRRAVRSARRPTTDRLGRRDVPASAPARTCGRRAGARARRRPGTSSSAPHQGGSVPHGVRCRRRSPGGGQAGARTPSPGFGLGCEGGRRRPCDEPGCRNRRPLAGRPAGRLIKRSVAAGARVTPRGSLDRVEPRTVSFPGAGGSICGLTLRRADVAQLVEQRFCKPQVPGSSPVVGSKCRSTAMGSPRGRSHPVRRPVQWVG